MTPGHPLRGQKLPWGFPKAREGHHVWEGGGVNLQGPAGFSMLGVLSGLGQRGECSQLFRGLGFLDWALHSPASLHRGPCTNSHSAIRAFWVSQETDRQQASAGLAARSGMKAAEKGLRALRKALEKGRDPHSPRPSVV